MRTLLGFVFIALSACAVPVAPPVPVTATRAPAQPAAFHAPLEQPPPADPAGPLVVIGGEHITIEGKPVGSVLGIDPNARLTKVDALFEALKNRRAMWKAAHQGEAFAGVASLVVAPGTSGRVFASVFQTMAFAGFPTIHVAVGGRYYETSAQVPGPPCGISGDPCVARPRRILHVQADESLWRLRVPREDGPLDASGDGPRATAEAFHAAAAGLMSTAGIDSIIVHVAPNVTFARLAPFLVDVVDLGRRAALAGNVTISLGGIDAVQGTPSAAFTLADGSTVAGRLAPELIQKVVRANFGKLRKCYEHVLARDPNATGKAATRFVIDRSGAVPEAHTTLSGNLPPDISACVETAFRGFTFEAPSGGIVTVTYPIVFSPGE
ncbi:hypothetical protein A7982_14000 [Minicystis rosea]|nr:hypothetical protein A7982_14000 [Minicystis rosea]